MDDARELLVVEDSPADFELLVRHLRLQGVVARCHRVDSMGGLEEAVARGGWSAVLSDFNVPELEFRTTLALLQARLPDVPLILVSGSVGEEHAVELLKLGVWDFVLKDNLTRLVPVIERSLRDAEGRRARREAEAALIASEKRYRALFEGSTGGILVADIETRALRFANPAICQLLGYPGDELLSLGVDNVHPPESLQTVLAGLTAGRRGERSHMTGVACLRRDGTTIQVEISTSPVEMDGRPCLVGFFTDVTERTRLQAEKSTLEAQIRQAQRLEAVGRLAGGVAHDFNNILQAMMSELHVAQIKRDDSARIDSSFKRIGASIRRGAELTRQLLLFARGEKAKLADVDLNKVVADEERLLRRLLREDIRVEVELAPGELHVMGDSGQLAQIVMNLVLNAADAMPEGGWLRLTTGGEDDQIWLAVEDNGGGIPAEVVERIFEPFFTTKESGKGTGLGLSVVHGIVTAHGGRISVDTRVGRGSTFQVTLPRLAPAALPTGIEPTRSESPKGHGERVLLVEDQEDVRNATRALLELLGYEVSVAATVQAASAASASRPPALLLSDIVLPDGRGELLAASLRERWPDLAVVLMSGYPGQQGMMKQVEASVFLPKPFDADDLAHALWRAFGRSG